MPSGPGSAGSRIVSAGQVRVKPQRVPVGGPAEPCDVPPQISTREAGGVIQEIIVTCACGKNLVLECDYGSA